MDQLDQAEAEQASPGYRDGKDAVLERLHRIEGQVRGLRRLAEDDQYRIDVLTQVAATTKALQAVAMRLLEDHLGHCFQHAVAAGRDEAQDKVAEATRRHRPTAAHLRFALRLGGLWAVSV
ncbi:metal-sensitive transcriptional regulator [Streptomyces sp. 2A115]|uniref:metal-sensitive transcriptional regulator n=1 Tax=Streptomyces sp. 2A115 TaxID=3457439 RepID=UPI003FD14476